MEAQIEEYVRLFFQFIGIAAAIATLTPNEADNKVVDGLLKIINVLGANVGKAKNGG